MIFLICLVFLISDVSSIKPVTIYRRSDFEKLHEAIRTYNELQAFTLIEYDFHRNVDVQNGTGWAPLHVAAHAGSEAFAAFLIDNHANLRIQTKSGMQPLHTAVINNRLSFAQLLLRADSELIREKCCGLQAKSVSHLSAEHNIAEFLYLMPQLFNATELDGYGQPPICLAARNGSVEFARKYFDHAHWAFAFGIDEPVCVYENGSDRIKAPLLHVAAYYQHLTLVELLLINRQANVSSRDSTQSTALHAIAMRTGVDSGMASTIAGELEELGADVEARDMSGRTPYLVAILSSNTLFAQSLVERFRVDISVMDELGFSAFHLAPHSDVIGFLTNSTTPSKYLREINRKSKPHCPAGVDCPAQLSGLTPLLLAVKLKRDLKYIKYLVEHSANYYDVNDFGQSVLHLAVEAGHTKALKFFVAESFSNLSLFADNYGRTALFYAVELNKTDAIQVFVMSLERQHEVFDRPSFKLKGYTPLHMAVQNSNLAAAEMLLKLGGANLTTLSTNGRNPFQEAVANHNVAMVTKLLELSPPELLLFPDRLGRTALHLSVSNTMPDYLIAKLILRHARAVENLFDVDMFGDTPLQRAIFHESYDIVKLYLEHNASCEILDAQDRTPLMLANQINNDDLIALVAMFCKNSEADRDDCKTGEIICDVGAAGNLVAKTCSAIPSVLNGQVEPGTSFVGSVRKFHCNLGYVSEGLSTVNCTNDGRWAIDGHCRKACPADFEMENGVIDIAEGSEFGLLGSIRCASGHRLFGHNLALCNLLGQWEIVGRCQSSVPAYYTPDYFLKWNMTVRPFIVTTGADIIAIITLTDDDHPYENPSVMILTHQGHVTALSRNDWSVVEWQARVSIDDIYLLHAVYDPLEDDIYFTNYGSKLGEQIYRTSRWSLMTAGNRFGTVVPLQVLIHREQSEGRRFRGLAIDSDARLLFACDYDGDKKDVSMWLLLPSTSYGSKEATTRGAKLIGYLKLAYSPMFCAFHVAPRPTTPVILGGSAAKGPLKVSSDGEIGDDVLLLAIVDHNGNRIEVHAASYKLFARAVRREHLKLNANVTSATTRNDDLGALFRHVAVVADLDKVKSDKIGSLYCPNEVAFDPLGNLFVADNCNFRVQAFQVDLSENIFRPMNAIWALNNTGANIFRIKVTKNPKTGKPGLLTNYAGNSLLLFD